MVTAAPVHPSSNPHSVRSYRANTTILVVDDDRMVLAVLRAILAREGYNVISAASPVLAIELAGKKAISMLVTDFQMPGMDGFVLASRLAGMRVAVPVLVMSGSDPSDLPIAEIAERHWNFMPKPIDRERLLRIIDSECLGWAVRLNG